MLIAYFRSPSPVHGACTMFFPPLLFNVWVSRNNRPVSYAWLTQLFFNFRLIWRLLKVLKYHQQLQPKIYGQSQTRPTIFNKIECDAALQQFLGNNQEVIILQPPLPCCFHITYIALDCEFSVTFSNYVLVLNSMFVPCSCKHLIQSFFHFEPGIWQLSTCHQLAKKF